jgi:hypothetical protein
VRPIKRNAEPVSMTWILGVGLMFVLFAVSGVGVGVALTAVQNRYTLGDPMNDARLAWLWSAVVLWIVAWAAVAYHAPRGARR